MAYNNVTDAIVRKVCKKYGAGSIECETIMLVQQARVPYECIAEVMKCNAEQVKQDLTGTFAMEPQQHAILTKFLHTVVPLGIERGVLPCKDTALTSSVLRLLVELCGLKNRIKALQNVDQKG